MSLLAVSEIDKHCTVDEFWPVGKFAVGESCVDESPLHRISNSKCPINVKGNQNAQK